MVDKTKYVATADEEKHAAALADSSEAAYKLGDMYSRGKFVECDMAKDYQLWSRSLDLAEDIVEVAQPAIRIAQLLLSEDCESAGAKCDPMRALQLFQLAEIGLRIDIKNGQTYYRKRLEETIKGRKRPGRSSTSKSSTSRSSKRLVLDWRVGYRAPIPAWRSVIERVPLDWRVCRHASRPGSIIWRIDVGAGFERLGAGASTCRLDVGHAKASLSCWWLPRRG